MVGIGKSSRLAGTGSPFHKILPEWADYLPAPMGRQCAGTCIQGRLALAVSVNECYRDLSTAIAQREMQRARLATQEQAYPGSWRAGMSTASLP